MLRREILQDELRNDFEISIFKRHPVINKLRDLLYEKGAIYASMTGSGSSVYGIFEKNAIVEYPDAGNYFYKIIEVR